MKPKIIKTPAPRVFPAANRNNSPKTAPDPREALGLPPHASVPLLQALHILSREGTINQDSRRKLKQVQHLLQFIKPLLFKNAPKNSSNVSNNISSNHSIHAPSNSAQTANQPVDLNVVDHGAGKSYLGFMLYDWFARDAAQQNRSLKVFAVENRPDLVQKTLETAHMLGLSGVHALALNTQDASSDPRLPQQTHLVTALHACDTATDDAIAFAIQRRAQHLAVVPCCQAQVAGRLRGGRALQLKNNALAALWQQPHHTREFGSQLTNVLRCLQLQAHGYQVTVTELTGWEHSLKNELILASFNLDVAQKQAARRLRDLLAQTGLGEDAELQQRFFVPHFE